MPDLTKTYRCEETINYTFNDPLLLWEALQADGAISAALLLGGLGATPRYSQSGNRRLAIIGDSVLDLLLELKWYPTWTSLRAYNTIRISTLSNAALQAVGNRNRLERYIGRPAGPDGLGRVDQKTMSTTVEAIVGAAYLEGGMDAAKTVVEALGIGAI
ncbi:MAG: hypothetical protein Q9208_005673 [Pyrenodesmia sp. 3 TL-2023]